MFFQLIIQIHNVQNIEKLTLILVKTLHLHVKNRARIHLNAVVFFDIFCETHLVAVFDIHKFLLRLLIVRVYGKLL